jgi:hypothetical protein
MDFVFVCAEARTGRFGTLFWHPLAALHVNQRFLKQFAERLE